jgi:hypothetical protein
MLELSIQQLATANILHSYWNIEQYPLGDYLNFQVWDLKLRFAISQKQLLQKIQQEKSWLAEVVENRDSDCFVKNGFYKNGKLHLAIINKSSFQSKLEGKKKATELATAEMVSQNVSLTGLMNKILDLVGYSILTFNYGDKSKQLDGLYLADGPWGLDYMKAETSISSF